MKSTLMNLLVINGACSVIYLTNRSSVDCMYSEFIGNVDCKLGSVSPCTVRRISRSMYITSLENIIFDFNVDFQKQIFWELFYGTGTKVSLICRNHNN